MKTKNGKAVCAIDPGNSGAIIVTDGEKFLQCFEMPIEVEGKDKRVSYRGVIGVLVQIQRQHGMLHTYLERAMPMAMGSKGAFTYGRGFEAVVLAIMGIGFPMTMVEPSKWTKEMHEGISADLKPKARSMVAVKRLYPQLVKQLPQKPKGGLHDGPIDALLIAGYGLRKHRPDVKDDVPDFL